MRAPIHHLERLTVEVDVGDADVAFALRDRMEHLAEGAIARALEQVLEDLAPTNLAIKLDRIEIDLGAFEADRIEAEAPVALQRALREALDRALTEARASQAARSPEEAALEDFETFLLRGTAPLAGSGAKPADVLQVLIAHQPKALATMLRRRAGARYVIERLALHVNDADFAALLAVLAPADAAVILAYMVELGRLYPTRPAPPIAEPALRRILRVLTFEYLLNDPGGAFNRKRYAEALLRGLAQANGMSYAALLAVLETAIPFTQQRRPVAGSLLGVLMELAEDEGVGASDGERAAADEDIIRRAMGDDLEPLLAALRAALARPKALEGLVRRLDSRLFGRVVSALEPVHAEIVLTYVDGLGQAHAQQPMLPLSEAGFALRLRGVALRFLLQDAGSSFNRRAWLRRLLTDLARESGVDYAALLASLLAVIGDLRAQLPPRGALPAALEALAADLPEDGPALLATSTETAARAPQPLDRLAAAERFLRAGAPSGLGPQLEAIATDHPTAFASLLRRLTRAASDAPGDLIDRLLAWMAPETVAAVLWPGYASAAARWADDLAEADGLDMSSAWTRVLTAGLRSAALAPPAAPPALSRATRDALLRHWLDQGTLAWWAPAGVTIADLLGDLAARPAAALVALFADPDAERVAARLRRVAGADDDAVLRTLAPWAFQRGGPQRALSPAASGAALDDFRIRAAAAAVLGDATGLQTPAPPTAPYPAPSPPEGPPSPLDLRLARQVGRDPQLDAAVRRELDRPEARARMAASLPDAVLADLVRRLQPGLARLAADLIAILILAMPGDSRTRTLLWTTALAMLAAPPSSKAFADRLIAALSKMAEAEALRGRALVIARRHGHAHLVALLKPGRAAADPPRREQRPPDPELGETHYVANAGLVLLNPFLPRLFETLGVLSIGEDGKQTIAGLEATSRAVHALQYLTDGRTDAPEPDLVLNKVLCGLGPATPIEPAIAFSEADRQLCDSLLTGVISNWGAIPNTSIAGLRETFLQREGRLRRADDRWSLEVQRRTLDILTDQAPWSIAVVYHRWMPDPVHVAW